MFTPQLLPLELLKRSGIIREVIKTYYANDTMLRWSVQLRLAVENHHFEGSTHLKSKEGTNARLDDGGVIVPSFAFVTSFAFRWVLPSK